MNFSQKEKSVADNKLLILDYLELLKPVIEHLYEVRVRAKKALKKNMLANKSKSHTDFRTPKNGQKPRQSTLLGNFFKSKGNSTSRVLNDSSETP